MANVKEIASRRSLFIAAWILLLASVFIPAPSGFYSGDAANLSGLKFLGEDLLGGTGGTSGGWVIGQTVSWSRGQAGAVAGLGFRHVAALTMAFFANVAFFAGLLRYDSPRASRDLMGFLAAAVGAAVFVALCFPVFARLPAYWLWLAALVVLACAFIAFEPAERKGTFAAADLPLVVWMWSGFVIFWLSVTYLDASHPSTAPVAQALNGAPAAKALGSYFNDPNSIAGAVTTERWNAALAAFEKETSNQVAVAIYPRSPSGAIEEFTMAVADRSRLGRKGLDNGAILFVFMAERRARLEVGYGLEGVLTDVAAHRILEERLQPAFARGDYAAGIDATLDALLGTVRDAYTKGLMPTGPALLWQQVRVAAPLLLKQAWPALAGLDFLPRFLSSFFGGVFATIACYVLREVVRTLYYFGRLASNIVAPRPGGEKIERIGFGAILEKMKLLGFVLEVVVGSAGFALAAIAGVAGIVIVAAGGGFGGAGAMVRW